MGGDEVRGRNGGYMLLAALLGLLALAMSGCALVDLLPRPAPPVPPCCADQGGTWGEAPGRVCETDLPDGDRDCWHDPAGDGCDGCWLYVPCPPGTRPHGGSSPAEPSRTCVPDPTPAPSASPTPTAETATPTPTPTAAPTATVPTATPAPPPPPCVTPPPADRPVPLQRASNGRCPRGWETVDGAWCVVASECREHGHSACFGDRDNYAWAVWYAQRQGHWTVTSSGYACDGGRGWYDAFARVWRLNGDCSTGAPDGPPTYGLRDPEGQGNDGPGYIGVSHAVTCDQIPTPPPTPVGPTPTPNPSCAPVEALEHWMAPGNSCHAWQPEADGRIRCLVDSTIRPICDRDHPENWDSFCGQRDHDPPYDRAEGAQLWTITGAEDSGPSDSNYAQRWLRGWPGAQVSVTVCIRPDARTPDGCRIPRRGDGCGSRLFELPGVR